MEEHKISFSKTDYEKVDSKISIKANDYKSHTFVFEFEDDFDKAILKFKRADGKVFAVDINAGKYTLAGAEIAIAGTVECEISFYVDDSRISTNIFTFEVVSDINTKNMTDNAPEVSVFDGLIKEVTAKEKERGENENERKSAEEARKTAEDLRVSSETERAAKFSQIETKFSEYDRTFDLINNQPSKKVKGEPNAVCENSLGYAKSIVVNGSSTQDGTPTYDLPKDITDYSNKTLIIKNADNTLSQSVSLPYVLRNVKGTDGTTVKNSDNITVDYEKGKVYFNQNIGVYTYTKADEAMVLNYTIEGGSAKVVIASALEDNVSVTSTSAKLGVTSNYGIQCNFSTTANNIGLLTNGRNIYIRQSPENFADLQAFKTWLNSGVDNNKPLVVYYSLANPVVTDISDTDCGKSLLALKVYKDKFTLATEGTTNEMEYIVTIDSALNELKQAIITLGGNV